VSKSAPSAIPEDRTDDALADPATTMLFTARLFKLLDLMRRASTIVGRREFDISGIEARIMISVGEHAPLSLNELADLIRLDRGQLSRAVKAMVTRGLLNSRRRPGGPALVITLTSEGATLHGRMEARSRERNKFLLGAISDDEIELTARVLDAVTRNAEILLEKERAYGIPPKREAGRD
jgi:DNA-binding MarR family transcriptional regulator